MDEDEMRWGRRLYAPLVLHDSVKQEFDSIRFENKQRQAQKRTKLSIVLYGAYIDGKRGATPCPNF